MEQKQQFNGIEVHWSGNIGSKGRKFSLNSKRQIARMILAKEVTRAEVKSQLRCSDVSIYNWIKDYEAGHYARNVGTGHYGTRRIEHISLVGRLSTEVERLIGELEVVKQELALVKEET